MPDQLFSERELEILTLLSAGASNEKIGKTLFISVNTVKTHVQNIYLKLEVNNRTEAATKAIAEGLVGATG